MTQLDERWPSVALDPLMRLRVLGASLAGVAFQERTLAVPFEEVWSFISDLERSVPSFDPLVRSVQVLERSDDGEHLVIRARPSPFLFRVELTEGLCLMHSAVFMVVMAAEPVGPGATRFGHLEGVPTAGPRVLQAVQRPIVRSLRPLHRRNVRHDIDGIVRCLSEERRRP